MYYWNNQELIPFLIKFGLSFAVLAYGSWTDLKTREVPDWINYGLLITGLSLNLLFSVVYETHSYFLESVLGLAIFFGIAYIMFYAGQWGGGDSKMLMGLGAMVGINVSFGEPQFLAGFFINTLFIGACYGLLWSFGVAIKNGKKFAKEYKKSMQNKIVVFVKKLLLIFCIIAVLSMVLIKDSYIKIGLLGLALAFLMGFYLWVSVKSVEKISMYKHISPEKLTEGDWIVKKIYDGKKYIAGPTDLGIEKKQIQKLIELHRKGKIKKILIKEGIPFVPSFLLAFVFTLLFGNLLWILF